MNRSTFLLLVVGGVLASSSQVSAAQPWDMLEARLQKLFDEAVLSPTGKKLVDDLRDNQDLFANRLNALRRYRVYDKLTVRFDSQGHAVAKVVAGAGALVVAEQVHANRMVFLKSLFKIQRYVEDQQWEKMTQADKDLLTKWNELTESQRNQLRGKHKRISDLAKRNVSLQIEKITNKLKRDDKKVELLVQRGKLYAQLDGFPYAAWVDLSRAVAIDPKHDDVKATIVLIQKLRSKLER